MSRGIRFYSEEVNFRLRNKGKIKTWLSEIVLSEQQLPCDLTYIFCSDSYLLDLNRRFLDHDTLTDILTFANPDSASVISGEIFISVERVKENAALFNQDVDEELARVMAHGVLHLLGYKDKTLKEKKLMTAREDHYLAIRQEKYL